MTDSTEAQTIANYAILSTPLKTANIGTIYTVPDGHGGVTVLDVDKYGSHPRRTSAARKVSNAESFAAYLEKHGLDETEVYADVPRSSIIAVIDSHQGAELSPGWEDHTVTLVLEKTKSWIAWIERNETWFTQTEFAEFIEQRATDVVTPIAGDLMNLVQTMYMTKGVEFQSAERQSDGQTEVVYKEKIQTKGLGKMELPKSLFLALQPYVAGPRQHAIANFRTRLDGAAMKVGYVLVRPEEILEGIFADIVTELREGREATIAKPAIIAITHPIYYGKP